MVQHIKKKMKSKTFFFGTWCVFFMLSACAQKSSLRTQLQLLQNPLTNKYPLDSTGFSEIKKATFFTENGDTNVFRITSENAHLVDFNNDGEKDMIYQENRPYQATILLVKKGNDFLEIWNGSGALVAIKKGEKTAIYVLTSAIGCFDTTMVTALIVKNDTTISENILMIHTDTEVNNIHKTFEQKTISGILRTKPIVYNKKKTDPCTGDLKTGNQIRTIHNKEVTVIKSQNEWLQVVLKEKDHSSIGWVKI